MQKRILPLAIIAVSLFSFFNWNCTKLDTTDIGSDLLPAVDNVHTFDTTLNIITTQFLFNDTTVITRTDDHALGSVNNDPLFGKTTANIFLQLKPSFYPYYLGSEKDTLTGFPGVGLDSIVLCFPYKGFWGDTALPLRFEVHEVNDVLFRDSVYIAKTVNYQPTYSPTVLGAADVDVRRLGDTIKYTNRRDYSIYQVRINLSKLAAGKTWSDNLYARDSLAGHAFRNDSLYREFYHGLAIIATATGNGLMYTNLADTSTKLEIHFRRKNKGVIDTVYNSFKINKTFTGSSTSVPSNTANNIIRNRAGARILSPNSDELYLQASPGSYINLNIPGLSTLSNRIIHRAEIIVEQIPTDPILDFKLSAPGFLYLDLKDTGTVDKWKPVYFDLNPNVGYDPDFKTGPYFPTNGVDYSNFGGYRRDKKDVFGMPINHYTFNISRHVQQIVTNHTPNYAFRLFAPYSFKYTQYTTSIIPYSNNIAAGRVRIGSGTNPNYKLRLRIIYSKI